MSLDKSKKFATVFRKPGAKYFQDGKYFDASGKEVDLNSLEPKAEDKPKAEPKAIPKPRAKAAPKPKAAPKVSK